MGRYGPRQPLKAEAKKQMLGSIDKQEREQLAKQGGVASSTPVAPDPDTNPSQDAIEAFLKAVDATTVKKVDYGFPEKWLPVRSRFEALRGGETCQALWQYMSHRLASVRVEAEKLRAAREKAEREAKARAAADKPYAGLSFDAALALLWDPTKGDHGERLLSWSEWDQGGGLRDDPAYREMLRLEKAALVDSTERRESTRETAGQAAERLVEAVAPELQAFKSRSFDAQDKTTWKVGKEGDAVAISCVDAAIPLDVQIEIGVLFIMTVWTPLFSEWLKMNGIMITLARILTVGGIEIGQAMVLAAQCAEGTRDDTCPATPLAKLYDAKYGLAERDHEGKFTLGGSVLKKIVRLDPYLKPTVPKVIGVCVQKAILAGAINFREEQISVFACSQGKYYVADVLFRNGKDVDFAASIGIPVERFPVEGTVTQYQAHGIEIQYDIKFKSSGELWTVIEGSLDDFMAARHEHYVYAKAEHERGNDVETKFKFYSVFATGPTLEAVVRGGVGTCLELPRIQRFNDHAVVGSELYAAAKAAAAEIFRGRELDEFTSPVSLLDFFCPEGQTGRNYTIWCGRDFDIYYYKNGVLVRVVKADFLMRRIQALMRSRALAAGVGAAAARAPALMATAGGPATAAPVAVAPPLAPRSSSRYGAGFGDAHVAPAAALAEPTTELLRDAAGGGGAARQLHANVPLAPTPGAPPNLTDGAGRGGRPPVQRQAPGTPPPPGRVLAGASTMDLASPLRELAPVIDELAAAPSPSPMKLKSPDKKRNKSSDQS